MIKLAIYGKGGIGKSTTVSHIAVALAKKGLKVIQIGCDPKADSTLLLRGDGYMPTVLDLVREKGNNFTLEEMTKIGFAGVVCVEAGGPAPGTGCAGRGILVALEKLREKGAYEVYKPDVVLYDVLGDVVCGGFTAPMRAGHADFCFAVTSGENMSLHAASNIAQAVNGFGERGYARFGGLILNRRNVRNEQEKVEELAEKLGSKVVGMLDRSLDVNDAEELCQTVFEALPESEMVGQYTALAESLVRECGGSL